MWSRAGEPGALAPGGGEGGNMIRNASDKLELLLRFLREHQGKPFHASRLKLETGVPKSQVRGLLAGMNKVQITTIAGKPHWKFNPELQ
jgi:hypothetical protein